MSYQRPIQVPVHNQLSRELSSACTLNAPVTPSLQYCMYRYQYSIVCDRFGELDGTECARFSQIQRSVRALKPKNTTRAVPNLNVFEKTRKKLTTLLIKKII